jgi:hypothetical protein
LHHISLLHTGQKAWGKKEDYAVFVVRVLIKHVRVVEFTFVKGFAIGITIGRDFHFHEGPISLGPYHNFYACGIVVSFGFSNFGRGGLVFPPLLSSHAFVVTVFTTKVLKQWKYMFTVDSDII